MDDAIRKHTKWKRDASEQKNVDEKGLRMQYKTIGYLVEAKNIKQEIIGYPAEAIRT